MCPQRNQLLRMYKSSSIHTITRKLRKSHFPPLSMQLVLHFLYKKNLPIRCILLGFSRIFRLALLTIGLE